MTTREFDPLLAAALRNELEALVDGTTPASDRPRRPVFGRPQVWITAVTALVLLVATLGVLHVTQAVNPAHSGSTVVDPLTRITDPTSALYVAREVNVLIDARGTGSGTHSFDVPSTVKAMRIYLNCTSSGPFTVATDHDNDTMSGTCDRDSGSSSTTDVVAGTHQVTVTVPKSVAYSVLIIANPAPTISTGPLLDPLTQVRDRRVPDAVLGDTRPLVRVSGHGTSAPQRFSLPSGVRHVRVFLACLPGSASTLARIDGHTVSGCMNSIAHWYDFAPAGRSISAQVVASDSESWSLLVIPAPAGAKDSPANAVLPYPTAAGGGDESPALQLRGAGAQATGTYLMTQPTLTIEETCRGTGWLEIAFADGSGTGGPGDDCSVHGRSNTGFSGPADDPNIGKRLHVSVIPHGDISWSVTVIASSGTTTESTLRVTQPPPSTR